MKPFRQLFAPTPIAEKQGIKSQLVWGFTLVEILISLLILGLGILSLFNLFPLALQTLSYSRRLHEVSFLAQKKMEELKSARQILAGEMRGKEGDLSWKITVLPLKFPQGPEVIYVEIDIEFDFQTKPQKQRFLTYIASR